MSEEETRLEAEKQAAEEVAKKLADERAAELSKISKEELAELLSQTRSEAKERRLKARELEDEIVKLKAATKKVDEDKLIADGEIQKLLDSKILELAEVQTERDKFKTEAEESKAFKAKKVEGYKIELGDKWNPDFANLSLTALNDLVGMTKGKTKIISDNGSNGKHSGVELTADQKRTAIGMYPHVSEEKAYEHYVHNLIKSGQLKEK
jgi:hypothetical protein